MKSSKPYLVRAIFDWCIDEGFTPYILASLSDQVIVPRGHDKNDEIILNISPTSVTKLVIDDLVSFSSRFAGIHEDILIPIDSIKSIYAQENGEEFIEMKDREIVAIIAYIQRLGTDIKVKEEQISKK